MGLVGENRLTRLYYKELKEEITIIGCSNCPFTDKWRDVNPADPDEGYYFCLLLGREVWGEDPQCHDDVFQFMARQLLFFKRG
jgi:hypothetical protein